MSSVEVTAVRMVFGRGRTACCALDDVSLRVAAGEMVALIGASGSGKSTLLRLLAGLLPASAGRIAIGDMLMQSGGRISPRVRRLRARIGVIFQQFNLIGRLPVLTNVLAGALSRTPLWRSLPTWFRRDERLLAMAALHRVGIAACAMQRASTLSGGQQQRAAIARTLVQRAEVILADEPIASLDPASSQRVMEILARINREDRVTVLVSLHQVEIARRFCPRIVALRHGQVVYDGPSAGFDRATAIAVYGDEASELFAAPSSDNGSGTHLAVADDDEPLAIRAT